MVGNRKGLKNLPRWEVTSVVPVKEGKLYRVVDTRTQEMVYVVDPAQGGEKREYLRSPQEAKHKPVLPAVRLEIDRALIRYLMEGLE